ncbi:hypothetical protein AHAS_Ahas20G0165800 [Arachis hypogaea]
MVVFGGKGLVSMVVQNYVEEEVHRYFVVGVDCHEEVHHNHCLGAHHRMVVDSALEEVVAKRVDQILVAPPIFDCPIHDPSFHCNLLFL